jgi:O-antigen/teichoic acid export membrane protein
MTGHAVNGVPRWLGTLARFSPEATWIIVGQVLSVIGGLLGVRLLTELLSPTEYGRLALALTLAAIAQQVVFGPLAQAFRRFYAPAREAIQLPIYGRAAAYLLHGAAGASLAAGALALTVAVVVLRFSLEPALGLAILVFAVLSGYSSAIDAVQSAARRRAIVALHQGLGQILRSVGAAVACFLTAAGSAAALLGYIVASAGVLSSQSFFLKTREAAVLSRPGAEQQEQVRHWGASLGGYAWPFACWGLFTWAQTVSDRWALEVFSSTAAVGTYVVLYQLGYYPVTLASNALVQLLAPILFDRAGDARDPLRMKAVHRAARRLLVFVVALTVVATVLAAAFHRSLFSILVAGKYGNTSVLLPLAVLGGGLFACGQVAVLPLLSEQRTTILVKPKVVTAVAGIVMNVTGARLMGVPGVLGSVVLFGLGYLGWVQLLVRRRAHAMSL